MTRDELLTHADQLEAAAPRLREATFSGDMNFHNVAAALEQSAKAHREYAATLERIERVEQMHLKRLRTTHMGQQDFGFTEGVGACLCILRGDA